MRIAVLGTGGVGRTLAAALVDSGDQVVIGTRDPVAAQSATAELRTLIDANSRITVRAFEDACADADLAMLCVAGTSAVDVARRIARRLEGKVLVDLTNPL